MVTVKREQILQLQKIKNRSTEEDKQVIEAAISTVIKYKYSKVGVVAGALLWAGAIALIIIYLMML